MSGIFSEKVVTSRRTYYFDVKETKDGTKYLVIGELTQVGSEMERHRVMVFEESLEFFMDGLDKAVEFILNGSRGEGESELPMEDSAQAGPGNEGAELMRVLRRIEAKIDQVREHFR